MNTRNMLAAAACWAGLALFTGTSAQAQTKVDANGNVCNGDLDGARQCLAKGARISTPDHPYRDGGESDGRLYGPGRGFTLGARELIYAAVPGSIVVLDVKDNYSFVKRITFETQPATLPLESIAGMAASPATNMIYVS